MQLAHQARTKKKITKDSLLARFNFRTSTTPASGALQNPCSSAAASSAPESDKEAMDQQTPPTSPIEADDSMIPPPSHSAEKDVLDIGTRVNSAKENGLPGVLEMTTKPIPSDSKGKGKEKDQDHKKSPPRLSKRESPRFIQPPVRIRPPTQSMKTRDVSLDSDSDLEILSVKKPCSSRRDAFDRLPAGRVQEGRSMQKLRALAHLTPPDIQRREKRGTMSLADMQSSLYKRARQQAAEEREAKIEDLKRRGIILPTSEERQQDQAEVDDMLEKARREGEEIMQKEKRAAKNAKLANGEIDDLPDSSDEDEDYLEDPGDEAELELSGSEEDEEIEEQGSDAEGSANGDDTEGGVPLNEDGTRSNGLIDDEASEDGDDEQDEHVSTDDGSDMEEDVPENRVQRFRRKKMVVDDDEDGEGQEENFYKATNPSLEAPMSPAGPTDLGIVPMGMTQAFAATMADTQTQAAEFDDEQDSMALLGTAPDPSFPMYDANDSLQLIEDSQSGLQQSETNTSKEILLDYSQPQIQFDASGGTHDQVMASQMSEMPDPTQDVGFALSSPPPERVDTEPPSTVDTILLPGAVGRISPVKERRRRLQRRAIIEEDPSDVDESLAEIERDIVVDPATNAFIAMDAARKASKAAAARDAFDKKKSEAKGMVEEQAQESEDEYAGLGGASDEDSGEEDEDVNAMMDHGEVKVDERRLAQLFA